MRTPTLTSFAAPGGGAGTLGAARRVPRLTTRRSVSTLLASLAALFSRRRLLAMTPPKPTEPKPCQT